MFRLQIIFILIIKNISIWSQECSLKGWNICFTCGRPGLKQDQMQFMVSQERQRATPEKKSQEKPLNIMVYNWNTAFHSPKKPK